MHYTGMAAMRLDALVRYDPLLFVTSLAVAVVLAIVALQVRFWIRRAPGEPSTLPQQAAGALILGFAVSAMHYTAMASTYCFGSSDRRGTVAFQTVPQGRAGPYRARRPGGSRDLSRPRLCRVRP